MSTQAKVQSAFMRVIHVSVVKERLNCRKRLNLFPRKCERRRLFLPLGTLPQKAAALRAEGWVTVAALTEDDSAEAQICTHILSNGRPAPLD